MTKFLGAFSIIFIFLSGFLASASVTSITSQKRQLPGADGAYQACWFGSQNSETALLRTQIETYLVAQLERAGLRINFAPNCLTLPDPFFPVAIGFWDATDNTLGVQSTMRDTIFDKVYPGHPMTYFKGKRVHDQLVDIVLTAHFKDVAPNLAAQSANLSPQGAKNLLLSIALHEFLHALGIEHEQDRADSLCRDSQTYSKGIDIPLTIYDADSVMNYCHTHFFDFESGAIPLTELDLS